MADPDLRRWFMVITVIGAVARIGLALTNVHGISDVEFYFGPASAAVRAGHPGVLYHQPSAWIYPPGLFPWLGAASWINEHTFLAFAFVLRLPLICSDVAFAFVLRWFLGRQGATERTRLAAYSLVLLGPLFVFVSGYASQIDGLALLPAFVGLAMWVERPNSGRRAMTCGALIGLGALVKAFPLVFVLALLPTARSWRERLALPMMAGGVLLAGMSPFLRADRHALTVIATTVRLPGVGGSSLAVQPDLVRFWLDTRVYGNPNTVAWFFLDRSSLITAALLLATFVVVMRRRTPAPQAAVSFGLAMLIGSGSFFYHWALWIVVPMLFAASLRRAFIVQAALVPPAIVMLAAGAWHSYTPAPHLPEPFVIGYVVWMSALLALLSWWWVTGLLARQKPTRSTARVTSPCQRRK